MFFLFAPLATDGNLETVIEMSLHTLTAAIGCRMFSFSTIPERHDWHPALAVSRGVDAISPSLNHYVRLDHQDCYGIAVIHCFVLPMGSV